MKKLKINNKMAILVLFACIVTAFSFLKSSAVSSQKNEVRTNPNTEYQITYELNGGIFEGEYPKTFKISQETSIPNPIKDGSEFLGWTINDKTDVSPIKDYKIPSMTKEDVKLTAKWKNKYNMLVDGKTFNKILSEMSGFHYVREIRFLKEKPNGGTDLSLAKDNSILGNIINNILYISSEKEIYANPNCSYMFDSFGASSIASPINTAMESIIFENFNTSQVTDMKGMFRLCDKIKGIDVSRFDTSQVTDMGYMFSSCSSLISIDLSSFDTSNVKNMHAVFKDCNNLTNLNLNGWSVNNVTTMNNMFYGCSSLINLDLSSFKTASLTNTGLMFTNCSKLENIKGIEKFDTNDITDMYNMFQNCTKLSGSITIMNPHTANYDTIFSNCSTSTSSKFIVNYIGDFTKIIAKNMVATKSTNSNVVLGGMPSTLVDGSTFNSTIKGMSGFANITEIRFEQKSGTLRGTDVSEAKDGSIKARISGNILYVESNGEIFANKDCTSMFYEFGYHFGVNELLNKIIFNNFNTEKVTAMDNMFSSCMALTSLDVSNWDTSKVTDMNSMFGYCYTLQSVNVSNFDTSQVADMSYMFNGCGSLTSLDVSNFNTSKVTDMGNMFKSCSSLTSIKGIESFDTSQVADMSDMFNDCSSLTSLYLSNFDTSQVTDMSYMFFECYLLTSLDVSNFNTSKVTDMGSMFKGCSSLTSEITISNPNITIKYGDMFLGCSTVPSAKFIVKYTDEATKTVAEKMVATKSSNSNVYLDGTQPIPSAKLIDGTIFNSTISGMSGFENVTEIRFIKGTPNPDGVDVSEAQDGSIKAYIEGTILTVASKGEIYANPNCRDVFFNLKNILNIKFDNFDTSQVTDMQYMFDGCGSLTSLDVSNFDTSKVTDMESMFANCISLKNIDVSNWDTSQVTDMHFMFFDCNSLTSLDLSKWDTSNVTDMSSMFSYCNNLNGEITIMNPNVTSYSGMFIGCSTNSSAKFIVKYVDEATKVVAERIVTTKSYNSNVFLYEPPKPATLMNGQRFNSTISGMSGFDNVTEIRFIKGTPNPNGTNVAIEGEAKAYIEGNVLTVACEGEIFTNENCGGMFMACSSLTSIDLRNLNTSQATNMSEMFAFCNSLKSLDVTNLNTSQVTDMVEMFSYCSSLTSLVGIENWDTSQVTDMSNMFRDCISLTKLDLSKLNLSQLWNMGDMFYMCKNLSGEITITHPNPRFTAYLFTECSTNPKSKFVVNYTSGRREIAQNMIYTKSSNSNVVLGTEVGTINDIPNNEEASVSDTVTLTIKDGNTTTTKEILAGEIGSLNIPSKEGMIFSGYFYDAEFTKPVSERDVIAENTTIYIKWEEVPQVEENPQEETKEENLEVA